MNWFRRHMKTGSRLALFALALQFVLSFGHSHLAAAQVAPAIQALTDLAQAPASEKQQPASHDDEPSKEPCAICAVTSMANQMAFATPAVLPLPDTIQLFSLQAASEFARLGTPGPAFRSRAPPVS